MKRAVAALTMGALLVGLGGIPHAGAQTTFVWTGFHENNNFSAANNWKGNAVPTPLDGTILLSFPSPQNRSVHLDSSIHVLGLVAAGHLHIGGTESSLTLGASGISFAPQVRPPTSSSSRTPKWCSAPIRTGPSRTGPSRCARFSAARLC